MMKRALRSEPDEEPRYSLDVTLSKGEHVIRKIPCKVWLPKRIGESPLIRLYPKKRWDQIARELRPPFELKGRVIGFGSDDVTTVSAREVWAPRATMRHHGKSRTETTVETDVYGLQILEHRSGGQKKRLRRSTQYWITECPALHVGPILEPSYTGEVKIHEMLGFEITLGSGAQLRLERIFQYEDRPDGRLCWPELIARHDSEVGSDEFARVDEGLLDEIDDFLAIVSFAAGYRSVCVGFDAWSETFDDFRYYRGHITVPEQREWDRDEAVIGLADFNEFIRTAYANFVATGPHHLIRHALHLAVPRERRTMESSFTTLYAALETIVLWYREKKGLVYIFENDEDWESFRDYIRDKVGEHELVLGKEATQKEKRKMLRAKVDELKRVPFRRVADLLCDEYSVGIDDLWPLHDHLPEVSLSDIRNRIVHGGTFDRTQHRALICAGEHMRWTVNRVLLGVLGWPVERSNVRNAFLQHFTMMTELASDREAMKEPNVGDQVAASGEA